MLATSLLPLVPSPVQLAMLQVMILLSFPGPLALVPLYYLVPATELPGPVITQPFGVRPSGEIMAELRFELGLLDLQDSL